MSNRRRRRSTSWLAIWIVFLTLEDQAFSEEAHALQAVPIHAGETAPTDFVCFDLDAGNELRAQLAERRECMVQRAEMLAVLGENPVTEITVGPSKWTAFTWGAIIGALAAGAAVGFALK